MSANTSCELAAISTVCVYSSLQSWVIQGVYCGPSKDEVVQGMQLGEDCLFTSYTRPRDDVAGDEQVGGSASSWFPASRWRNCNAFLGGLTSGVSHLVSLMSEMKSTSPVVCDFSKNVCLGCLGSAACRRGTKVYLPHRI